MAEFFGKMKTPATLVVFASKEFKLAVDLFPSLRQLLTPSATRGPLEEVLNPTIWSEELLHSPVTDFMSRATVTISDVATIAGAVQKLADRPEGALLIVDSGKIDWAGNRNRFASRGSQSFEIF